MGVLADIQAEVVRRLRTNAAVTALVPAASISDGLSVPQTFPRIALGNDRQVRTGGLINRPEVGISTIEFSLIVLTQATGFVPAKDIAGAVAAALRGLWTLPDRSAPLLCEHQQTRFVRHQDGITQRAMLVFSIPHVCEAA